jgi:tRNA A-37 threonylcarbamoyl transferase component Bud32
MLESGRTICGRYRIDECIGDGGTSTVYRGHDLLLDRTVAIKRLATPLLHEATQASFILNEARLTATLSHPGIVMLHDAVEDGDERYLIMEYVEGATLRDHLAPGPVHPAAAVELADQVGEALAYAHRRNIVHGDVKPENILLAADGRPRLLDFGVARLTPEAGPSASVTHGTAAYAAPEVLAGQTPSAASDVYSLGAVLHEMVTGLLPGETADPDAEEGSPDGGPLLLKIVPADLPATLEAVVDRATHPNPLCRYQSVQEFLHALHAYQRGALPAAAEKRGPGLPRPAFHWDAGTTQRAVLAAPLALGVVIGLVAIIAWGRQLTSSGRPMDMIAETGVTTGPFSVQLPPALLTPMETVIAGPEQPAPIVVDPSHGPTDDPFQFCAMVGTTDTPSDGDFGPVSYTGPAQPFPGVTWRCWNGLVLGCEGGPRAASCMKVSSSRTPSAPLVEYCRANPESEPPLSAMGPTTVFDWSCQRGRPLIVRQRISEQQIDGFGYRIGPWYTLSTP